MSDNNGFRVADIPEGIKEKHESLRQALLALPEGKAICVPRSTFRSGAAEVDIQAKRYLGRPVRQKTIGDEIYLWLAPVNEQADKAGTA